MPLHVARHEREAGERRTVGNRCFGIYTAQLKSFFYEGYQGKLGSSISENFLSGYWLFTIFKNEIIHLL